MSVNQLQGSDSAPSGPLIVYLPPVTPLNVPRRRTICAFGSSVASPASETRRHTGPAPISIDTRPTIRPLPQIPLSASPKSAPPIPRRRISLRPLPRVPEPGVSLSVTPASPLSPSAPIIQSNAHLSPPSTFTPPRFASLSLRLETSPDALEPRVLAPPLPPIRIPSAPEPPSPATARRRRISKLRRHLGESVQLEIFSDTESKGDVLDICTQTAVAVKKLLELDTADDSDTSSDDDAYSLVFTHGQAHCAVPVKRYSRKWIREKGGQRWVEENYSDIIRDLRAL
ncbi:hypothetical protein DFH07DRAFT_830468 [Mycena maculata]|uniref:Uncharacterized protein n=1 Tax=Mycena maculata TaxID=230809 RepID=A0AAD7IPN9_9AGAR|nr:hypothetical protein DFH07DRAFT_830468 [Mycena maculata]